LAGVENTVSLQQRGPTDESVIAQRIHRILRQIRAKDRGCGGPVETGAFRPFLDAAYGAGVRSVIVLSVMGAEKNPLLPHHAVEREVMARGFDWTMLRPADFMQHLETVHRDDIRLHDRISVPAGYGVSAFIDVVDVAAVAAKVLLEPGHASQGYTLTGPAALSFSEIAKTLSDVLGRPIEYQPPGVLRFIREQQANGVPLGMALIMTARASYGCNFRTARGVIMNGEPHDSPILAPCHFRTGRPGRSPRHISGHFGWPRLFARADACGNPRRRAA
jgi:hypothetical protein